MRKTEVFLLVLSITLISLVTSSDQINGPVATSMNVSNSSPVFFENISNISIALNFNYTNQLNLFDHFVEPNGDNMAFSYTPSDNLTIIINQTSGEVSIYPDYDFIGTRYLVFYATDGQDITPSNNITIDVGTDTEPPKWHNPRKSKTNVYQSSHVNLTVDWTDNVGLREYLFSYNQGSGWINETEWVNFTGTSNNSLGSIQISAPALTTIQWTFYAIDIFDNMNSSGIQTFQISEYPTYPGVSGAATSGSTSGSTGVTGTYASSASSPSSSSSKKVLSSYLVDVDKLKVSIKQGESTSKSIKITNQDSKTLNLTLSLRGLDDLGYLGETTFSLPKGEVAVVTVDFIAAIDQPVDEYFGSLLISSDDDTLIPIVVDVSAFEAELELRLNISEEFKIVKQGNPVKSVLRIQSLKDLKNFKGNLTYSIKDFEGKSIDLKSKEIEVYDLYEDVLELTVPQELPSGEYIFFARFISEDNVALDSKLFRVGTQIRFLKFLQSFLYLILLIILIFILLILFIMYKRAKRKRKLLELYMMLNELRYHVKHDELDAALNIYIRIKNEHGQPVSTEIIKDKDKLKAEMKKFASKLKERSDVNAVKQQLDEEKEKGETKKEEKKPESKEGEEKKVDESKEKTSDKKEESKPEEKPTESKEKTPDKKEEIKESPKKEETKELKPEEKKEASHEKQRSESESKIIPKKIIKTVSTTSPKKPESPKPDLTKKEENSSTSSKKPESKLSLKKVISTTNKPEPLKKKGLLSRFKK